MSDKSTIEWTDATWNPVKGCSKISAGCENCYAMKIAARFSGPGQPFEGYAKRGPANWTGKVQLDHRKLLLPLSWRRHRRIFVNSMSDLFHAGLSDEDIDYVFGLILACKFLNNRTDHTFQVLTKRADRMAEYFAAPPVELLKRWSKANDGAIIIGDGNETFSEAVSWHCAAKWHPVTHDVPRGTPTEFWSHPENLFPLSNLWLGVSVESQATADERVPHLLRCPAAVRFVSAEPLLGPVDLSYPDFLFPDGPQHCCNGFECGCRGMPIDPPPWLYPRGQGIDWVIVGGESGPNARPIHPAWARSLRDQCSAAGVPFLFKQWGEWLPGMNEPHPEQSWGLAHHQNGDWGSRPITDQMIADGRYLQFKDEHGDTHWWAERVGKKAAGRLLDGVEWNEFPQTHSPA